MPEIPEKTQREITQLQNMQRQLQMVLNQRQRFEFEVVQIDSALAELEKAEGKVYKSLGTILIEEKKDKMIKDMKDRRENINTRIETLKKQEEKLQKKTSDLQKSIEDVLEKKAS